MLLTHLASTVLFVTFLVSCRVWAHWNGTTVIKVVITVRGISGKLGTCEPSPQAARYEVLHWAKAKSEDQIQSSEQMKGNLGSVPLQHHVVPSSCGCCRQGCWEPRILPLAGLSSQIPSNMLQTNTHQTFCTYLQAGLHALLIVLANRLISSTDYDCKQLSIVITSS